MGLLLNAERWRAPQSPAYIPLPVSPNPPSDLSISDDSEYNFDASSLPSRSSLDDKEFYDEEEREQRRPSSFWRIRDAATLTLLTLALGGILALFIAFPFPTTIHLFIPLSITLALWVVLSWSRLGLLAVSYALHRRGNTLSPRAAVSLGVRLVLSTALVGYWLALGVVPPAVEVPALHAGAGVAPKVFIAANLYNSEEILPTWSAEIVKLVQHLGPANTFVSIYESNSNDNTPALLTDLSAQLTAISAPHRIISDKTHKWWAYGTSPERIGFLADARNRALEPLQSANESTRLSNYADFDKVLFLNDVVFTYDAAVRLLATEMDGAEYDLACGMDFHAAGIYDSWVARDVCGTPLRVFWPYVKDPVSAALLREERVFEMSACWNGMVAFPAGPYLYRPEQAVGQDGGDAGQSEVEAATAPGSRFGKRGWEMIDNSTYPHAKTSPPLTTPIKFRVSGIDACDHSECFLFSYDLHRMYPSPERPPRIFMNPSVRTAYVTRWWRWHNVILRIPAVQWWRYHWSHGVPLRMIDWLVEALERRRDFCTWAALARHKPDRCPALPGAVERKWHMAG